MKKIIAILALALIFTSCKKEFLGVESYEKVYLKVAPKKVEVNGFFGTTYMTMKAQEITPKGDGGWFYISGIEGFQFEEGVSQVIYVRKETLSDPPQDGSGTNYVLLRVVSKTKE